MSSKIARAADAIVTLIGPQTGYTVEWGWAVQRKLEDFAKTGWIFILPASREWPNRRSRVGVDRMFELSIGVQKRHNGVPGVLAPRDAISEIEGVAEAIGDLLMVASAKIIGSGFKATCQDVGVPMLVDDDHLAQLRLVTSVMTVKYKVDPNGT